MNHPCSLCGSTNWPDPESLCPLCDGPAEHGPDPDDDPDHDSHDDQRYDDSENRLINGIHHAARSHRNDATISRFDD